MNYGKIALMKFRLVYASALSALVAMMMLTLITPNASSDEVKVVAKKTAKPIPSPSPKWPPKGFTGKDGVFAKVPSRKELIGLLSARRTLQSVVKKCEEFACGAVIAAAETGCKWWEVNSNVFRVKAEDLSREKIGTLTTYTKGSDKRKQSTIFLISSEPVAPGISISGIKLTCHRDSTNQPKAGNIYKSLLPLNTPES